MKDLHKMMSLIEALILERYSTLVFVWTADLLHLTALRRFHSHQKPTHFF